MCLCVSHKDIRGKRSFVQSVLVSPGPVVIRGIFFGGTIARDALALKIRLLTSCVHRRLVCTGVGERRSQLALRYSTIGTLRDLFADTGHADKTLIIRFDSSAGARALDMGGRRFPVVAPARRIRVRFARAKPGKRYGR